MFTACGIIHPRCCRPATSWVHYTTSCNTQSSAPEDGRNHRPKHVELIGIINKPLLLHLGGYIYILFLMVIQSLLRKCRISLHSHCSLHQSSWIGRSILLMFSGCGYVLCKTCINVGWLSVLNLNCRCITCACVCSSTKMMVYVRGNHNTGCEPRAVRARRWSGSCNWPLKTQCGQAGSLRAHDADCYVI